MSTSAPEHPSDHAVYDLPFYLVERGRAGEYLAIAQRRPGFAWREAALALVSSDSVAAAEIYKEMGAAFPEAWARLLAAEAGHTEQLSPALEYFTRVRAISYIERCDALLKASA